MIMPNDCRSYLGEMTGGELRKLVKAAVSGYEDGLKPLNKACLPVFSGISVKVKETGNREFEAEDIVTNRGALNEKEVYTVAYIDNQKYYLQMAHEVFGNDGTGVFQLQDEYVRDAWTGYIREGNGIEEPSGYITLQ